MSPRQFLQGQEAHPTTGAPQSKKADIGLTKAQMQEALLYMIQVRIDIMP